MSAVRFEAEELVVDATADKALTHRSLPERETGGRCAKAEHPPTAPRDPER